MMKTAITPVKHTALSICARPQRHVACCAAVQPGTKSGTKVGTKVTEKKEPTAAQATQEDIYIGKGKYVRDDPSRYPSRTPAVGGWAGGEQALWQFRDEILREATYTPAVTDKGTRVITIRADKLDGDDFVYIGKGEYVKDDGRKYPGRETTGLRTGGFAGGERGLQAFNAKGTLPQALFADSETVRARQRATDTVLLTALVALTTGSALALQQAGFIDLSWIAALAGLSDDGGAASLIAGGGVDGAVAGGAGAASAAVARGAQAKLLQTTLLTVVAAGAGVTVITKARSAASKVGPALVEGSKKSVVTITFGAVVVAAAYYVLRG